MKLEQLREIGRGVRLVISDMDGTLLNSDKKVTDRTWNAVKELRDRGIRFTICTGRIPAMAEHYIRMLEIDTLLVAANGAVVWDGAGGRAVYERPIPPAAAQKVMDYCRFRHMDYCALTLGASYFVRGSKKIRTFHQYNEIAKRNGCREMELRYLERGHGFLTEQNIDKILIYEQEPEQYARMGEFLKGLPEIASTSSDEGLWDVSAEGADKGSGLRKAAGLLGVDREEICAFGDYDNDLPMLKAVGLPVAMGNGCEQLRSAASYVTLSNDQDGVADAVEKLLLCRDERDM